MSESLLFNGREFHLDEDLLPCLLSGKYATGLSFFTILLLVDLFMHGSKILLFSAYPTAKELFLSEIKEKISDVAILSSMKDLKKNLGKKALVINNSSEKFLREVLDVLPDRDERIILIKNIDEFSKNLFSIIASRKKIILSGNIDECSFKNFLLKKAFRTKILFSKPHTNMGFSLPKIDKYQGYMHAKKTNGFVQVGL